MDYVEVSQPPFLLPATAVIMRPRDDDDDDDDDYDDKETEDNCDYWWT